jgi:hypothetical protein
MKKIEILLDVYLGHGPQYTYFRLVFHTSLSSSMSATYSSSDFLVHKLRMASVLSSLIIATHCHSCGDEYYATLRGYCGAHCSKGCWSTNEFYPETEFVCPFGGCIVCDCGSVATTRSVRHRHYGPVVVRH